MSKLKQLPQHAIDAMPGHAQKWIDKLINGIPFDAERASIACAALYKLVGLSEPQMIRVCSPLAAQYAANMLAGDQVRAQVRAQVHDQVRVQVHAQVHDQVSAQVNDQVSAQVRAQVDDQVRAQVHDQVRAQVDAQVRAQVRAQVDDQVDAYYWPGWWGGVATDAGYLAWASFYQEHNLCRFESPCHDALMGLSCAGVYNTIYFRDVCIICELPQQCYRDAEHRLHSTTDMAIKWRDGFGVYALWGVRMPAELHKRITDRTITAKEALALDNIEQRMVALKYLGAESVIDAVNSTLISTGPTGNKLYKIVDMTPEPAYALRYACPSTGREYVSFVDPVVGGKSDADLAMAWKFGLTKEAYQEMELQS